jgi:hypothetical protein
MLHAFEIVIGIYMDISEFIKRLLGMEVEGQNSIIVTLLVVFF